MNPKPLRAIFIFPDEYQTPSTVIHTVEPTNFEGLIPETIIETNGHPDRCVYFSFLQRTQNTNILSWVNRNVSPTMGIIQLLAWQINYEISWVSNTYLTDEDELRFIMPQNSFVGHEPWDIDGNNIRFLGRKGCFTVPGIYAFFVIRSPNLNVALKLRIRAVIPCNNSPYFIGNFCLKNCYCDKIPTYQNIYDDGIIRIVDPDFISLQDRIVTEFNSRSYNSCFPPTELSLSTYPKTIMTANMLDTFGLPLSCGITYTTIIFEQKNIIPGTIVIVSVGETPDQFTIGTLNDGIRHMSLEFILTLILSADAADARCIEEKYSHIDLLAYNFTENRWKIVSRATYEIDIGGTPIVNINKTFLFDRNDDQLIFTFRIYAPLFQVGDGAIGPIVDFSGTLTEV